MTDEMKKIIESMGKEFVKIDYSLSLYSASGIFKTGKTKKSVTQEVKYFEDKCPLEALKKLNIALIKYKEDNKKIYDN